MPLNAVVPERALSFFVIDVVPHDVPSHVTTPTPMAIVASGSTLVSWIVTGPSVETAKGFPVVPSCPTVPEKTSVVVAGVGVVVDGVVLDAQAALNKKNVKMIETDVK